jgi:antitoxin (DNA-binding transcriptional repressor) of toxin-antitoxin stability system
VRVGLREVNQDFSAAARAIRGGEEVLILDRGRPFALMIPLREDEAVERMERSGFLTQPREHGRTRPAHPVAVAAGSAARLVAEERSGW